MLKKQLRRQIRELQDEIPRLTKARETTYAAWQRASTEEGSALQALRFLTTLAEQRGMKIEPIPTIEPSAGMELLDAIEFILRKAHGKGRASLRAKTIHVRLLKMGSQLARPSPALATVRQALSEAKAQRGWQIVGSGRNAEWQFPTEESPSSEEE